LTFLDLYWFDKSIVTLPNPYAIGKRDDEELYRS